jgi:hypothetical protein
MNESYVSVPVLTEQFIELVDFIRDEGSDRDPVIAVQDAIAYWISNASWKQEDLLPEIFTKDKGYKWKEVFLPHGTSIRMRYKGEYYYAKVESDNLIFQEQVVSPNEFADKVANCSRNAWRDLEVRRPGDMEWFIANSLRLIAKKGN